jgi:hypothetical protein
MIISFDPYEKEVFYLKNAGVMKPNLRYVPDHISGVPQKLQAIDPALFVMFNPDTDKFEIHRKGMFDVGATSVEMNLPYKGLDERAVMAFVNGRDVWKVKEEIEANNAKIKADRDKEIQHETSCRLRDLHDYCYHHEDRETLPADAYSTREV